MNDFAQNRKEIIEREANKNKPFFSKGIFVNQLERNSNVDFNNKNKNKNLNLLTNKFFNKIKKTSKEKYISDKSNQSISLNNNLISVSGKINNFNNEKNNNLNIMRTAHLNSDNVFLSKNNINKDQGTSNIIII